MARRRLPNFLRQAEADALLAAAAGARLTAASPSKRRAAHLDEILLQTGLLLGLRVSELCKLDVQDLDLAARTAMVRAGKGDKDRCVPVPARLVALLEEWQGRGKKRAAGPVFASPRGGRLASRTVQLRLAALGKRAGLPRRLKPHTLRHTFATRLLERGASIREVQELLGHSSVATTEVYTHTVPDRLRGAVDRL